MLRYEYKNKFRLLKQKHSCYSYKGRHLCSTFLRIFVVNTNAFLTFPKPLPEGSNELIGGDGPGYAFQGLLEAGSVQAKACQILLRPLKQGPGL
jgi:hypothetical protein